MNDKLYIIEASKEPGFSRIAMARQLNICKSTIGNILKDQERILEFGYSKHAVDSVKMIRKGPVVETEAKLYEWVCSRIEQGHQISGPIVMEQARKMHPNKDFGFSTGWLHTFKRRFGLSFKHLIPSRITEEMAIDVELNALQHEAADNDGLETGDNSMNTSGASGLSVGVDIKLEINTDADLEASEVNPDLSSFLETEIEPEMEAEVEPEMETEIDAEMHSEVEPNDGLNSGIYQEEMDPENLESEIDPALAAEMALEMAAEMDPEYVPEMEPDTSLEEGNESDYYAAAYFRN